VTLVEMLVTVAILVIIMTILVQVFQAATGAVSSAQAFQQIDDQLRRVDGLIHSDLEGVTARFTPPLDPAQNLGYFEYGENEFADVQGEDSDDYIRFTAKAPEGRPFTGRMWVTGGGGPMVNGTVQPVTITSDYAEIIYFLRNGNLYRRVLLVAPQPEMQSSIAQAIGNQYYQTQPNGTVTLTSFTPMQGFGGGIALSWQGVNDISARPASRGAAYNMANVPAAGSAGATTIVLNALGDLTNRENRFASPRFADDFVTIVPNPGAAPTFSTGPDGLSDDQNGDNVPDYYPTIYPGALAPQDQSGNTIQLIYEPFSGSVPRPALALMGFPFVFPGAYSVPQVVSNTAFGWIHAPSPYGNVAQADGLTCAATQFQSNPLAYLQSMNHNPLDVGDNLPTPDSFSSGKTGSAQTYQTWWGFPTWRETLSPSWNDPTRQVNDGVNFAFGQPAGLLYRLANNMGPNQVGVNDDSDLLPPMAQPGNTWPSADAFSLMRRISQPFCDGLGDKSAFMGGATATQFPMWSLSWEDDLIMTGVRSFDVKAYDNSAATYVDLGWGDDFRIPQQFGANTYGNASIAQAPYLAGNYDEFTQSYVAPAFKYAGGQTWNLLTQTFAHEGRMPPLIFDNVLDAQYPNPTYVSPTSFSPQYPNISDGTSDKFTFSGYSSNVGDNNPAIMRLRRVWDSWSTEYTKAPANGIYNNPGTLGDPLNLSPWGPNASTPPIYPSYPPPYPAPLRGIQIQIRAVDPTNQRIKSLTIRQDFTDKL